MKLEVKDSCPACDHFIDAATDAFGEAKPSAGDLSVCMYCGAYLTFNADLTVAELSTDAFVELPLENRIQLKNISAAIKELKAAP